MPASAARTTIAVAEPANGSATKTPSRTRSEPIISALRESRSTSGPSEEAEEDGRQDVRDQQRADPPARVRAVVDVDLQRDDREPVADAGGEGREEEKPEPPVLEQAQLATEIERAHGRET